MSIVQDLHQRYHHHHHHIAHVMIIRPTTTHLLFHLLASAIHPILFSISITSSCTLFVPHNYTHDAPRATSKRSFTRIDTTLTLTPMYFYLFFSSLHLFLSLFHSLFLCLFHYTSCLLHPVSSSLIYSFRFTLTQTTYFLTWDCLT